MLPTDQLSSNSPTRRASATDAWPLDGEAPDAPRNDARLADPLLVTPESSGGGGSSGSSTAYAGAGFAGNTVASGGAEGESVPAPSTPANDSPAPQEETKHGGTEDTEAPTASGAASAHRSSEPPAAAPTTAPPDSLAPDSLAPDSLAPDSLAPDSLAPDSLAPDSLAPNSLAPNSLAPNSLAPNSLAPNSPAPPTPITLREFPPDLASAGWTATESGGTAPHAGTVTVVDGNVLLCEGNSFLVTLSYTFTVPDNPGDLAFSYTNLNLDTADTSFINDAFEVALVDQDGDSIVPTFTPSRDAFFNIAEDLPAALAAGVTQDGGTVTVSLADVPAGLQATLIFRLVNNDSDTGSCVAILGEGGQSPDAPPNVTVNLVNDTAPSGPGTDAYRSDGLTNDATVSGTVADDHGVNRLEARIDQGSWLDITATLRGDEYTYSPGTLAPGAHTMTIRATDTAGQTGQTPLNFIFNAPPVANAGGSRTTIENSTVQFDASGSTDAEAPLYAYRWTFEDGSTADGPTATRHYPQEGIFPVQLTVIDIAGSTTTDAILVTVDNLAPVIGPLDAVNGVEGAIVTLSAPFTDVGLLDTRTATVDWGDGTTSPATVIETNGQGTVSADHIYADNGVYSVTLTVTDNSQDSAAASTTATVANVAPALQASLGFEAVLVGTRYHVGVMIAGAFTDPGFDHPLAGTHEQFTLHVDWGDGTISENGTGSNQDDQCLSQFSECIALDVVQGSPGVLTSGTFTASHTYTTGGTFDVTATLCDDDGGCVAESFRYGVMLIDIKPAVRESGGSGYETSLPEGLIPVVMFGAATLDATQIAPPSLRFYPGAAPEWDTRLSFLDAAPQDGRTDAVGHFSTWDARIQPTDQVGWVIGQLADGTPLLGVDLIGVTPASARIPFTVADLPA